MPPNLTATLKPGGGVLINEADENSRLGVDTPAFWVGVFVIGAVGYFIGMHWGFRGAVRA
jgi:hypothetical protein